MKLGRAFLSPNKLVTLAIDLSFGTLVAAFLSLRGVLEHPEHPPPGYATDHLQTMLVAPCRIHMRYVTRCRTHVRLHFHGRCHRCINCSQSSLPHAKNNLWIGDQCQKLCQHELLTTIWVKVGLHFLRDQLKLLPVQRPVFAFPSSSSLQLSNVVFPVALRLKSFLQRLLCLLLVRAGSIWQLLKCLQRLCQSDALGAISVSRC